MCSDFYFASDPFSLLFVLYFISTTTQSKGVCSMFYGVHSCTTRNFEETKKSNHKQLLYFQKTCILLCRYAISSVLLNMSWLQYQSALEKHRYNCCRLPIIISSSSPTLICQHSHRYTHIGYLKSAVSSS